MAKRAEISPIVLGPDAKNPKKNSKLKTH